MLNYSEVSPYVKHMDAEHRRLHGLVMQARSAVRECGSAKSACLAEIITMLQRVRQELAHHFAEEEEGGCLEEAVARCPRLSAEAERLLAEHPQLLQQANHLVALAQDAHNSVADRVQLEHGLDELMDALSAHELAENDLLQQALGLVVNGDDCAEHAAM